MEILVLNWKDVKNPQVGGAEIIAFEFAKRLVKEGHKVTFFSRSFSNCLKEEILDGVKIVRRGNRLSVYLQAFLYYRSLKCKPDRVIDMVNTICWQTPLYVPEKNRIAYVNQLAKEVLFYELPWYLAYPAYFLEALEYQSYKNTKFICYSESTKKDLLDFGINKDIVNVFSLGLDHDRYLPGLKKDKNPLFIFVARLVRMKRADICIMAMKKIVKQYPKARLAIIGNGPDEERLSRIVKELNLSKNVIFVNKNNFFLKKDRMDIKVKLMQEAWCLLLPSVKEGWGMVVTEAAACGTPSIVSNVTGLRDSVLKNKTGLILSEKPSDKELSTAMIEIINNNILRDKMSKESVSWSKNFNWDKSYSEFKSFIL